MEIKRHFIIRLDDGGVAFRYHDDVIKSFSPQPDISPLELAVCTKILVAAAAGMDEVEVPLRLEVYNYRIARNFQ